MDNPVTPLIVDLLLLVKYYPVSAVTSFGITYPVSRFPWSQVLALPQA
jgi:hypothetical protein